MLDGVAVGAKESLKAEWMYRWDLLMLESESDGYISGIY